MANLKLTPDLQKNVCKLISLGITYKTAAEAVGISEDTFYGWMRKGRQQASGKFHDFFEAVTMAQAQGVVRRVARIEAAGQNGSWQADAWYLERTRPAEYGRKERVEVAGDEKKPVVVKVLRGVSIDDL